MKYNKVGVWMDKQARKSFKVMASQLGIEMVELFQLISNLRFEDLKKLIEKK